MDSTNCQPDSDHEHWITRVYTLLWQQRRWFRALASLIIIAGVAIPAYAVFHHFGIKNGAPIVQELAAFAAIIVGAAWAYLAFVRNRQKYPRANTSMSILEFPLPNGSTLLKVINEIENIGNVLISIEYVRCSVYRIIPWPSEEVINNSVMPDNEARDIEIDYEYKNQGNDLEGWPCLDFRDKTYEIDEFEVEPGEKDAVVFDMLTTEQASLVRINTYVQNVRKRRQNKIGWSEVTYYTMGVGSVEENRRAKESGKKAGACEC